MGSSTKWVQFAFNDAFQKENQVSSNGSRNSASSSTPSQQSFMEKNQSSSKNNFFSYLPTCASYCMQSGLYLKTPTENADSDPQLASLGSSKKPQLPSFNNKNLLKKNDQTEKLPSLSPEHSHPTSTLKQCFEHLKLLQLKLKRNKEYAQKMFKQQEKKITEAKNKLLDNFSNKQMLIDDDELQKLIEKRKQTHWTPNTNNFKMGKVSSEKINFQENFSSLQLQSKVQANKYIKQSKIKTSQQKPKVMAPGHFQNFFTTFKTKKISILQQQNQPSIKYQKIFSRGKPKSSLKLFQRKPAQPSTHRLIKK